MTEHTLGLLPCPFCGGEASDAGVQRYGARHKLVGWFRNYSVLFLQLHIMCGVERGFWGWVSNSSRSYHRMEPPRACIA